MKHHKKQFRRSTRGYWPGFGGSRGECVFSPGDSEGRSRDGNDDGGRFGRGGLGRHGGGRPGGGRLGEGARGRHRLFDYGEIRLLVLGLIAQAPTYGYEMIRTIEQRFGGSYTPSPGVIYPTLTWLEEAGHVQPVEAEGRRVYQITPQGEAYLAANRPALDAIQARMTGGECDKEGRRRGLSMPVMRAMENLRTALRLRLRHGGLDAAAEEKIAAVLDEAARVIGQL